MYVRDASSRLQHASDIFLRTDFTIERHTNTLNHYFLAPFFVFVITVGSEEIDRLAKRFMKLDTDNSGAIDKDEFLAIPGIGQNPLARRVVDIFDEDRGGDIDFKEFVTGLSVFSSAGSVDDKLKFLFKVYDIDNDGYISNGELFIVLRLMVADSLTDTQLQQLVDRTIMESDADGDGKLSFAEFKKIVESTSDITQKLSLEDKI